MSLRLASRLSILLAAVWVGGVTYWVLSYGLANPEAWPFIALPAVAVTVLAVAAIGVLLDWPWLVAFSAFAMALLFFSPGLIGTPYFPAAGAIAAAAGLLALDPLEPDEPPAGTRHEARLYDV